MRDKGQETIFCAGSLFHRFAYLLRVYLVYIHISKQRGKFSDNFTANRAGGSDESEMGELGKFGNRIQQVGD